jgi:FAD:protein FMN transferase
MNQLMDQLMDQLPRRSIVEHVMGMPVSVHVRGEIARDEQAEAAIRAGLASLHDADDVFSTWRDDTPISRLQRGEVGTEDCPPEVPKVLRQCVLARVRTQGWFDHELPDAAGVRTLDPTGLVKGWAVERALKVMVAALETDGLDADLSVNAGGDIALHVVPGSARTWTAGVEDPLDRSRTVAVLELPGGGLATSGSAARGAHIVNPHTGESLSRSGSVTVYGPSLLWADVFATAAFAYGPGCGEWLTTLDGWHAEGWGAVIVDENGHATSTA